MRFAYYFPGRWVPPSDELMTGAAHCALALAAEAAGFDGLSFDEHPAPSERWRQGAGGHDAMEPFVGLAAVAGVTSRVQLLTYLAVLPYRNPFHLAKSAATLDVMSDGRLILGVGTGYLKSEFAALGVDFDERNALFDEALDVLELAWAGEPFSYEGRHFTAREVTTRPQPLRRPPVWIGGNSALTRRRVVARAQGWMPMPQPRIEGSAHRTPPLETHDDLRALIADVQELADRAGRSEPIDIAHSNALAPADPVLAREWIEEAEALGVTWLTVNGAGTTLDEALEFVGTYGDEVIAPLRR